MWYLRIFVGTDVGKVQGVVTASDSVQTRLLEKTSVKRRWIAYLPDAVFSVYPPPNMPCLFTAFRDPP